MKGLYAIENLATLLFLSEAHHVDTVFLESLSDGQFEFREEKEIVEQSDRPGK
jgi:hypothetical protein